MYYQWQVVVFLLYGFSVFQWCDVVNVYYVVVYLCFEVDDKIWVVFYCLLDCIGVNIGYVSQFVLGNKFNV